jgi:hypothetical protein
MYLESDECGREYFGVAEMDFMALCRTAHDTTADDGIVRRVGIEYGPNDDE